MRKTIPNSFFISGSHWLKGSAQWMSSGNMTVPSTVLKLGCQSDPVIKEIFSAAEMQWTGFHFSSVMCYAFWNRIMLTLPTICWSVLPNMKSLSKSVFIRKNIGIQFLCFGFPLRLRLLIFGGSYCFNVYLGDDAAPNSENGETSTFSSLATDTEASSSSHPFLRPVHQ